MKKVKINMCGSVFLKELAKYRTDFFAIEDEIINCSPLSVGIHINNGDNNYMESLSWEQYMRNTSAKWCIIDLRCISNLLVSGSDINGVSDEVIDIAEFVNPLSLSDSEVCKLLDKWIGALFHRFGKNVILISSFLPEYYIVENSVKDYKKIGLEAEYAFIKKWEDYLVKKMEIHVISSQMYYFLEKRRGYELDDSLFEKYCYMDVWNKLTQYLYYGQNDVRPNFQYSVTRYIKYFYNTIMVKAFNVFLDKNDLVDNFVLSSPQDIVKIYKQELVFKKYNEKVSNDIFNELFLAFQTFCENDGLENAKEAKMLFREKIVATEELGKIRARYKEIYGAGEKKITCENCGYYWAILNNIKHDDAIEYCQNLSDISNVLIDVFGSCVGRVALNDRYTKNNKLVTNNLWWHVPIYRGGDAIEYPQDLFPARMNYKDRNVRLQFDKNVCDDIKNSCAGWLLVDLYSLVAPKTFEYKGLVYTDFDMTISKKLGARRVKAWGDDSALGDETCVISRMQEWIETVKNKYGKNIIIIKTVFSDYWIGDDFKIYQWNKSFKDINKWENKVFDYLKKELNCYTIEVMQNFMSDECGYSLKSPVHMQLSFYNVVNQKVNYIIENEPEKKCYDTYDGIVRVQTISNLLKANRASELKIFFNNRIDDIVLQIPQKVIEQNMVKIALWYDMKFDDKDLILQNTDFSGCSDLMHAIKNIEETIEPVLPNSPTKYQAYMISEKKADLIKQIRKLESVKNIIQYTIIFEGNGADNLKDEIRQSCVRGRKDKLYKNCFEKKGYHFIGWESYRKSDKRSCYSYAGERKYYRENEAPQGAVKYLYPDEAGFCQLAHRNGDTIILTAVWEKDT